MQRTRKIKKVVTKVKLTDQKKDAEYWRRQPYAARLAELERIRQEYHLWKYGGETPMRKVVTIMKMRNDNS
jgi:hypothetical protein